MLALTFFFIIAIYNWLYLTALMQVHVANSQSLIVLADFQQNTFSRFKLFCIRIFMLHFCVSNQVFVSRAGDRRFKSRAGQIGHSVANGSPPLRHFFERSYVARAQ